MNDVRVPLECGASLLGLLTLVAANFLYLSGLRQILDPMMSMDTYYIASASRPLSSLAGDDPGWGILYSVWLKPLAFLLQDPLAVYTANLYALSLGVSVLIYAYLLLLTRRVTVAIAAALLFLISDFNVPLFSKVSGFALLVVLAGLAVSELCPAGARRMSVAAAGILFASYARPELYPAALFLCAGAAWLARREHGNPSGRTWWWVAATPACLLTLAFAVGTPLFSPYHEGGRFLMAFREHFAWNWARWNDQWRYYLSIWETEFGTAQTVLQAVVHNPVAVAHHVGDNLLGAFLFIVTAGFNHYPLLAPATSPSLVRLESMALSAGIFGSLILVGGLPRLRRPMVERYGQTLVVYATLASASFLAATVIYPEAHYLALPGVLLLLAGALAASLLLPWEPAVSPRRQALAILACLVAVPKPFVLPSAYVVDGSSFKARIAATRTVTDTVTFIRSLGVPPPVQVLTLGNSIGELLGSGFDDIKAWQKGSQSLETYMRDNGVDVIVTLEAGRESFVIDDPYWTLIRTRPEAVGYTRLAVPHHESVGVYIRTELIRDRGATTGPDEPGARAHEPGRVANHYCTVGASISARVACITTG